MKPRTRTWAALLALPILLLLPGCMRMQVEMKITDADNISVSMNIGMNKQLAAQAGAEASGETLCQQLEKGKPAGAKVETYDDGTYVGCKATGVTKLAENANTLSFDKDKNVWTFVMEGKELASGGQQVSAAMFTDFKVSVTFPGKVLTKSGSGTVSGNTVTWTSAGDLLSAEGLKATAEGAGAGLPVWLWIVLGVVALALIGALVYFLVLKKKPQAPVPPQYPGGAPGGQPTFVPPTGAQAPQQAYQAPGPGYQAPGQGYQPPVQGFQPPQGGAPAPAWSPGAQGSQPYQPPTNTQGFPEAPVEGAKPPIQGYQPPTYQPPEQGSGQANQ